MANIFKRFTEAINKPNRATYDLSFQNNVTMKFGTLYPVFCKEVLPGDSFRIKPTFSFNFMPLVSPVQTRMRAHLHFFYVRNRPHWKDFMDWDGMTKDGLTPPYLNITENNRKMIETGSIGDFLGLPTKVYGYSTIGTNLNDMSIRYADFANKTFSSTQYGAMYVTEFTNIATGQSYSDIIAKRPDDNGEYPGFYGVLCYQSFVTGAQLLAQGQEYAEVKIDMDFSSDIYGIDSMMCLALFDMSGNLVRLSQKYTFDGNNTNFTLALPLNNRNVENIGDISEDASYLLMFCSPVNWTQPTVEPDVSVSAIIVEDSRAGVDVAELALSEIPWANGEVRINAFPFRAYESIYNSFYRDDRNNPRMVNGQPEYNKFITTDEGGADSTYYKLYNRNWEPDFLTTAVQSPQQGVAPLVGITSVNAVGDITLTDSNGTEYTAKTTLADDGDTIVGINITSGNGTSSVNRALVDMASTGISISDLRNVNALQRWLEINMRRGLRYRDQVKSHYGVDLEYKELNMPEFIGGVSEDVIVNRISQTTETEANPLGSLAGQAGVIGTSKHDISHYCDEKGYIIGILSIAPVPNYSQILPKHLIKSSQLDYFTPEFAHIGMQPILNSEVSPLQASLEGKLNDVFGYQRPWYDYLASTDEVHGQFRDTLRRYLINRVFDGTPELGSEFLTIDSEQINDVFAVTDDTDKIYGQVYFDVTAKRPIAANVTPRIEP